MTATPKTIYVRECAADGAITACTLYRFAGWKTGNPDISDQVETKIAHSGLAIIIRAGGPTLLIGPAH